MLMKTHLIVTDQYDNYGVRWVARLIDMCPVIKNDCFTFVIISNNGRIERRTMDIGYVVEQAKKHTASRGRGSITWDKGYIYIVTQKGEELLGVVTHQHVRKYAPMYDDVPIE